MRADSNECPAARHHCVPTSEVPRRHAIIMEPPRESSSCRYSCCSPGRPTPSTCARPRRPASIRGCRWRSRETSPPRSFVSIVSPDTAEGKYGRYTYTTKARILVPAPDTAGTYEIRLYSAETPYKTLARRPIRIIMPTASLQAPDQVPIGVEVTITWAGPSDANEFITLVPKDMPDGKYTGAEVRNGTQRPLPRFFRITRAAGSPAARPAPAGRRSPAT